MGEDPKKKVCCVCLKIGLDFDKLTKEDHNNISLLTKFRMCISELLWLPSFYLCSVCLETLNIVHTFREQCLKSDIICKEQQTIKDEQWWLERVEENAYSIDAPDNVDDATAEIKLKEEELWIESSDESVEKEDHSIEDISIYNVDDATTKVKPEAKFLIESINDEQSDELRDEQDHHDSENKKNLDTEELKGSDTAKSPHKRTKHTYICGICEQHFEMSTKLIAHCVSEYEMECKEVKPFACYKCPKKFSNPSMVWRHMKYHEGAKSNICTNCRKGFNTKADLMQHKKKHCNKRERNCEYCNKSFSTSTEVRSHILMVHTDTTQWKFICEICTKPFPIKSNLDIHMRRHLSEKKFSCDLCDKKFLKKHDLQRHTNTHSYVREHQCPHCVREYKDKRDLKVHLAKIHGVGMSVEKVSVKEPRFTCDFCPKTFYDKTKLIRHLITHSGGDTSSCHIRNKKGLDESCAKLHLAKTHNV